jgi:branched-chain amino acid transport system ATP-binding protein
VTLLEVNSLSISYGRIPALRDVSLSVCAGEIVALIGANGTGKTSLLKAISRLLPWAAGLVALDGNSLARATPTDVVRAGISHVPEGRRVFKEMTIDENLDMGAYARRYQVALAEEKAAIFGRFPVLQERRHQLADTLSGGEQQMLAIARALMTRPRLLMLDEPSQGIMPKLVDEIFAAVVEIRRAGTTVLIVEQRLTECLEIADRAYVLQTGRLLMGGTAATIRENADIRKAYLGL